MAAGRRKPDGLDNRPGVQNDEIGRFACCQSVFIRNAECPGRVARNGIIHSLHLFITGHMADLHRQPGCGQHVAASQRIPGVHNRVVAEADIHAGGQQFFDTGDTSALGVGVKAGLQYRVVKGVGND